MLKRDRKHLLLHKEWKKTFKLNNNKKLILLAHLIRIIQSYHNSFI